MQTKTFTLLVTIRDDGSAAVMNPIILAAAVKGALETGIGSFMLTSSDVAKLQRDPLLAGSKAGEHNLPPVVSAEVDAFNGDATHLMCVDMSSQNALRSARSMHSQLRKSA